ncbi:MAG: hypothetical protein WDM91_07515 [Rhizomicrobium sp.]
MRLAIFAMAAALAATVPLTAEQDHQRILDELHITTLRPGVDGDARAPNAANYDEAKANPAPDLPDPLKLRDGTPVTSRDMWWQHRREEIATDYEAEVYGKLPAAAPILKWVVAGTAPETIGKVAATTRHLVAHPGGLSPAAFDITMTVSLPASAKAPVPVVLLLSGGAKAGRPSTWRAQVLARGWGAAELDVTSVQPDDGADLVKGVIGLVNAGKPRDLHDWGVLRAWAWGASRAMDYFEEDAAIDSAHVGIAGHSRYGKAALIAMAYDARYAVAYISSSGAGGAALLRRNFGERIENLAGTGEYHWFAGEFLQYAGPKTAADLPVDAHELFALAAPRPIFVGAGAKGDNWVDPRGMFMAEVAAGPVYALLGKKGLETATMPPVGKGLTGGELAFRQHAEGHTPEPNWPAFLAFAQRYLRPAPKKG